MAMVMKTRSEFEVFITQWGSGQKDVASVEYGATLWDRYGYGAFGNTADAALMGLVADLNTLPTSFIVRP